MSLAPTRGVPGRYRPRVLKLGRQASLGATFHGTGGNPSGDGGNATGQDLERFRRGKLSPDCFIYQAVSSVDTKETVDRIGGVTGTVETKRERDQREVAIRYTDANGKSFKTEEAMWKWLDKNGDDIQVTAYSL